MKKPLRLILAAALIGLAIWGWRVWFPSPQNAIRSRLLNLARTVSVEPGEGTIPRGLKAQSLGDYFTADVVINLDKVYGDIVANTVEVVSEGARDGGGPDDGEPPHNTDEVPF